MVLENYIQATNVLFNASNIAIKGCCFKNNKREEEFFLLDIVYKQTYIHTTKCVYFLEIADGHCTVD